MDEQILQLQQNLKAEREQVEEAAKQKRKFLSRSSVFTSVFTSVIASVIASFIRFRDLLLSILSSLRLIDAPNDPNNKQIANNWASGQEFHKRVREFPENRSMSSKRLMSEVEEEMLYSSGTRVDPNAYSIRGMRSMR